MSISRTLSESMEGSAMVVVDPGDNLVEMKIELGIRGFKLTSMLRREIDADGNKATAGIQKGPGTYRQPAEVSPPNFVEVY